MAANDIILKRVNPANTGSLEEVKTPAEVRGILNVEDGADVTDATNVAAAGAVMDADYTAADVVLVGTGVGTQGAVTLAASEFLAKKATGAATNVTATEARAILNVGDGADLVGPAGAADSGIPVFDGVTGKLLKDSGATIGNGIAGGSLLNLVAYTTDPVSPTAGDSWLLLSGGVLYFKYAVSSSDIRSVVLGEE